VHNTRSVVQCAVCGTITKNLLFKNRKLSIPICSKKCEHEYLKNLTPNTKEHAAIVYYLDHKIKDYRIRNRIGWGISGAGVILLLAAFLLPEVNLFIAGIIVVSVSALATRHYEDSMRKLNIQRKRLAI
jgi:hypothetical protein